jgi:hypothetical protein
MRVVNNSVVRRFSTRVFLYDVAWPPWCFPLSNVSATEVGVRLDGAGENGVGESIIVWRRGGAFPPWLHTIMPGAICTHRFSDVSTMDTVGRRFDAGFAANLPAEDGVASRTWGFSP